MASIDVLLVLGRNGAAFADLLRQTAEGLASGKHELLWKCITTPGYTPPEWADHYGDIPARAGEHIGVIHGLGINTIVKHAVSEYSLIIDADVAIMTPNWDDLMVNELTDGTSAVGFPNDREDAYQGFPCVIFCLARTEHLLEADINFVPIVGKQVHSRTTIKESKWNGRPRGSKFKKDTGWRMPREFYRLGYRGKVMELRPQRIWNSTCGIFNRKVFLDHLRFSSYQCFTTIPGPLMPPKRKRWRPNRGEVFYNHVRDYVTQHYSHYPLHLEPFEKWILNFE